MIIPTFFVSSVFSVQNCCKSVGLCKFKNSRTRGQLAELSYFDYVCICCIYFILFDCDHYLLLGPDVSSHDSSVFIIHSHCYFYLYVDDAVSTDFILILLMFNINICFIKV